MAFFAKLTKSSSEKSIYPWSQRKSSSSNNALPRSAHCTIALPNNNILFFNGIHRGPAKRDSFILDSNSLSTSPYNSTGDIPSPRTYPIAQSVGNYVLLHGGEPLQEGDLWDPHLYILNTNNRQWARVRVDGVGPGERAGHSSVVLNGIIYVWGGQRKGKYLDDLYAINMTEYPHNLQWKLISPRNEGPMPRAGHVSVISGNEMYIFGGTDSERLYQDIWTFHLAEQCWSKIPAVGYIPAAREYAACALIDDLIYVFGGKGRDGVKLGDLCAFRIKGYRWYMFQNMGPAPSPRHSLTMTAIKEKIYVVGGEFDGKPEDSLMIHALDSSKIKYPPEIIPVRYNTIPSPNLSSPTDQTRGFPQVYPTVSASTHLQSRITPLPATLPVSKSTPLRSVHTRQPHPHEPTMARFVEEQRPPPENRNNPPDQISRFPTWRSYKSPKPALISTTVPEAAIRRARNNSPLTYLDTTHDGNLPSGSYKPSEPAEKEYSLPPTANQSIATYNSQPPSPSTLSIHQNIPQRPPRIASHIGKTPARPSREGINLDTSFQLRSPIIDSPTLQKSSANGSGNIDLWNNALPSHISQQPNPSPRQSLSGAVSDKTQAGSQNEKESQNQSRAEKKKEEEEEDEEQEVSDHSISTKTTEQVPIKLSDLSDPFHNDRVLLLRELRSRDEMIKDMKKKEQWWKAEVTLARKARSSKGDFEDEKCNGDTDLMSIGDKDSKMAKLFNQLVSVKSELRRVRASIVQQALPASQKLEQADRMRIMALQEAAYYRSKYVAMKERQEEELAKIETERAEKLESRLSAALKENQSNSKILQQLQKRAQFDHTARIAAEERVKEAHERAEDAQKAHQAALEKLSDMYTSSLQTEMHLRNSSLRITELTNRLSEALAHRSASDELSEAAITISRLESTNIRTRNETASLKQNLAESMDDIARLRILLSEREEALNEANRQLEDSTIQLNMMKDAMSHGGRISTSDNAHTSTTKGH